VSGDDGRAAGRLSDDARRLVAESVQSIVGAHAACRQRLELGSGLWLDCDWRRRGWSVQEPSANHFTPQRLETAAGAALRASDE
jgi:hypothetical protein